MTIRNANTVVSALAALTCAAPAGAQTFGNPAGLAPDTPNLESGRPPPDHANTQDKLFVRQAALGNRAEVELAKLAQKKAGAEPVRGFARRMLEDHREAGDRLAKLSRDVNVEIPAQLDAQHQARKQELDRKASGRAFDLAYLDSQLQDHQKTVNLLLYQISFGQNQPLVSYAADTLPGVLDHLRTVQQRQAELLSTAPPR